MMVENWISTVGGGKFNLDDPEFNINDIAHALGMLCRFNGHCNRFYSVAEHSVMVANLMVLLGKEPAEGLLHDAVEAYIGDVVTPIKQHLQDFKDLEDTLEIQMRAHFNLPLVQTVECKLADTAAVIIEGYDLLGPSIMEEWEYVKSNTEAMDLVKHAAVAGSKRFKVTSYGPLTAKNKFMEYYDEIQEQAGAD